MSTESQQLQNNISNLKDLTIYLGDRLFGGHTIEDILETKKDLKKRTIYKKGGGYREVYCAQSVVIEILNDKIKKLLTKTYEEKLRNNTINNNIYGYRKGRSIQDNAFQHLNSRVVINVDIKNFFASIKSKHIEIALTKHFNCSIFMANFISEISTTDSSSSLMEGIAQSPTISNMVLYSIDNKIKKLCCSHKIAYSRYADDLSFSSKTHIQKESIDKFIIEIKNILKNEGFKINKKKIKIYGRNSPQYVTGLTCNDAIRPRISKKIKKNFRLENYYIAKYGMYSFDGHQSHSSGVRFGTSTDSLKRWGQYIFHIEGQKYKNSIEKIYSKFDKKNTTTKNFG